MCRWVEFTKKTVAKRVANMLNGEQIGDISTFYFKYSALDCTVAFFSFLQTHITLSYTFFSLYALQVFLIECGNVLVY